MQQIKKIAPECYPLVYLQRTVSDLKIRLLILISWLFAMIINSSSTLTQGHIQDPSRENLSPSAPASSCESTAMVPALGWGRGRRKRQRGNTAAQVLVG